MKAVKDGLNTGFPASHLNTHARNPFELTRYPLRVIHPPRALFNPFGRATVKDLELPLIQ